MDIGAKGLIDWIATGGATAVLGIVAYAFAMGKIIPRTVHDMRVQELTNDRDHWRDAYLTLSGPVERLLVASADRHAAAADGPR